MHLYRISWLYIAASLGVSLALPVSARAQAATCSTPDPFVALGGGHCVNGGWLPPGMEQATSTPAGTPSSSTTANACTTQRPGPDWVCVGHGWLPPGMQLPTSTRTSTPRRSPTPAATSSASCHTVRPGPDWICVNGDWRPPTAGTAPANAPTYTPPPSTSSACYTMKPGADWVCVNGGWLPPGMAPAAPVAAPAASAPAPTSTATAADPTATPDPDPALAPAPVPAPQPSTAEGTVRYLDWNIHHGVGTDGVCNLDRIAGWIAKSGANVVSLNEVEKNSGWCGNADEPAQLLSLVRSKTGKSWQSQFAQRDGNATGQGNLILTTFAIDDRDAYQLSYARSVSRAQITVNGITVNVFSTHLDSDSGSYRSTQMTELKRWAATFSEQRLIAGDFNAWPGAAEADIMRNGYVDGWAKAYASGGAIAYAGNEAGNTRNSRIDYVWMSQAASRLQITAARVFDVRDANGVQPSDHRPVMVTFAVK